MQEDRYDAAHRKLYATKDWKHLRKAKLQRNPLCERCMIGGYVEQATVVHHKIPHKGNRQLFYDIENLQSLCKPHHDGEAQAEEMMGFSTAVDVDGWPIDPRHPVNKRAR